MITMMGTCTNDNDDYVDDDDKNDDNDRKRWWWSLFKSLDRDPKHHLVMS